MADDKKKRGKPDRSRINLEQRWEVDHWQNKLGVTELELRLAVRCVRHEFWDTGTEVEAVNCLLAEYNVKPRRKRRANRQARRK